VKQADDMLLHFIRPVGRKLNGVVFFCKKSGLPWNGGVFFVKTWTFFHKMKRNWIKLCFLFYILLNWGTPNAPPPAYWPDFMDYARCHFFIISGIVPTPRSIWKLNGIFRRNKITIIQLLPVTTKVRDCLSLTILLMLTWPCVWADLCNDIQI